MSMPSSPHSVPSALVFTPIAAAAEGWSTDVPAALEQAQSQEKDLLIDFTGSDWCGWCMKLDEEVFSQEAFKNQVPDHFVLVELDFPQSKPQSDELKAQNQEWAGKLGVQGFPTIALVDSAGRPYAMTGYQQGGAEAYVEHLDELRQRRIDRDEMMTAAEQAEGIDKARHLDAALEAIGMELASVHYVDTIEQIVTLDPENEAGLNEKYAELLNTGRIQAEIQAVMAMLQNGQTDQVVDHVDQMITQYDPPDEVLMGLRMIQAEVCAMQLQYDAALTHIDQAIAAASNPQIIAQLKIARSQIETELQAAPQKKVAPDAEPSTPPAP